MVDPLELLTALQRFGLENDRFDLAVAHAHDMSLAEIRAVDHIQAEGELTPRELGERLSLTSGAITALIDRLERAGWVSRAPHPSDRRSVIVRMTAHAEKLGAGIYLPYLRSLQEVAASVPEAHRDSVVRFLRDAAAVAAESATEWRGSGRAPTGSPAPGSPPTPDA